ncbi:MAG: hypothetical protein AB1403_12105 [Candidatus Riflebacteria bacterium]
MRSAPVISLGFLLLATAASAAVDVETGLEGHTVPAKVAAPVSGKPLPEPAAPVNLPPSVQKAAPTLPAVTSLEDKKHLKEPAEQFSGQKPASATFPKTVGTSEAIEQAGKGTREYEAFADGTAELRAFLPTYNPARIIVRLIDTDGEEVYFKGKSLLIWERPDDKAYAPAFFQGIEDESSMKKDSSSDFTAVQNVYKAEIKQGQRLRLEISGSPESNSYIRAQGPLEAK